MMKTPHFEAVRRYFWGSLSFLAVVVLAAGTQARADQVINDDLIVDGSACIGFDCVNGESFGFDTIRIKENNLRIKAQDTSSTASFPSNDWQLTFNDSSNGGANKFSIDDIDGGRTPFTLEAGAPSHSLYVDDGGRLGFGTNSPVADLHVKSGNTPTLRLEQDGTSGFTPQTFDVAGNESNFFVRDATNGSTLPFRIQPGAASNMLYISAEDEVGLGTSSPDEFFHVKKPAESGVGEVLAKFNVSDDSDGKLEIKNYSPGDGIYRPYIEGTGPENHIALTTQASIGTDTGGQPAMMFDTRIAGSGGGPSGQVTTRPMVQFRNNQSIMWDLDGAGNVTATAFVPTSSRALKKDIAELDAEKAMAALDKLEPVEFVFKNDPDEPHVGFIAEDVPELVATTDRRGVSSMDVVAVVTKVVKEQQRTINEQQQTIADLSQRLNKLESGLQASE
jgi:hypothetical protein